MIFKKLLQTKRIAFILTLILAMQLFVLQGFSADSVDPEQQEEAPSESKNRKQRDDIVVVVTANRGEGKDVLDIPQSISKIDKEDIQNTVYTDVDDIIRRMPNVKMGPVADSGGHGNTEANYWQEGFSIRGLGKQRVLVINDGVRLTGQGVGYGGGNLGLFDPLFIENIEVLRGPSSVLYGTDAIAGVVNITTRNPKRYTAPGGNMGLRYSFDQARIMNRVSGYAEIGTQDYGLIFGWTFTDSHNPKLPDGSRANSGEFEQGGGWLKFDYYIGENGKLRFIANQTRADDVLASQARTGAGQAKFSFPIYERTNLGAELEFSELSDHLDLFKVGVYWQKTKRELDRSTFLFSGNHSLVNTDDRVHTYEIDPQLHFDFDPHIIIVGADIALDTVHAREHEEQFVVATGLPAAGFPIDRTRIDAKQQRLGLYIQDTWELYPVELVLGGRLDHFNVNNSLGNAGNDDPFGASGSIGVIYHYSEGFSYYANIATGFRVPDLSERFQDAIMAIDVPVTITGNPALEPERSYSFEVGSKSRFECMSYEFSIFANQVDNYIGLVNTGAATKTYNNIGHIFLYGYEATITANPEKSWFLYLNAARTYTKNTGMVPVPKWTFNYGSYYKMQTDTVTFLKSITPEIHGHTQQKSVDLKNNVTFESFSVFDVQVAFELDPHWINSTAKWVVGVKNIANKQYKEPFFNSYQPHRSIFTSIQMEF